MLYLISLNPQALLYSPLILKLDKNDDKTL